MFSQNGRLKKLFITVTSVDNKQLFLIFTMVKNENRVRAAKKAAKKNPWIQHVKKLAQERMQAYKSSLQSAKQTYQTPTKTAKKKIEKQQVESTSQKQNSKKESKVEKVDVKTKSQSTNN